MANISITVIWVRIISRFELGQEISCMGNVSFERDCYPDQAVFLLLPKNAAVVLQPVNT